MEQFKTLEELTNYLKKNQLRFKRISTCTVLVSNGEGYTYNTKIKCWCKILIEKKTDSDTERQKISEQYMEKGTF